MKCTEISENVRMNFKQRYFTIYYSFIFSFYIFLISLICSSFIMCFCHFIG